MRSFPNDISQSFRTSQGIVFKPWEMEKKSWNSPGVYAGFWKFIMAANMRQFQNNGLRIRPFQGPRGILHSSRSLSLTSRLWFWGTSCRPRGPPEEPSRTKWDKKGTQKKKERKLGQSVKRGKLKKKEHNAMTCGVETADGETVKKKILYIE